MLTGVFSDYINLLFFSPLLPRTAPIHAEAPEFTDMSVEQEILVTGIKVVDLLAPYAKGGKIGMSPNMHVFSALTLMRDKLTWFSRLDRSVRWCRCRQDCIDHGADQQRGQGPWWLLCVCWCGRAYP